jgi:hypothetical protein
MSELALTLARLAVGLFTGAAVYVALVEQPARMHSQSSVALAQFRESLPRAERMQPALLLVALLASSVAYALQPNARLLVGAVLLLLIVPLTFGLLVPINRRLLSGAPEDHVEHGMRLVGRWGRLHVLRAGLALGGAVLLHL